MDVDVKLAALLRLFSKIPPTRVPIFYKWAIPNER